MTEKQTADAMTVIKKDEFYRRDVNDSYSEFYLAAFVPAEVAKRRGWDVKNAHYNYVDTGLPDDDRHIETDVIVIPYKNNLGKHVTGEPTAYYSYEAAVKKLDAWRRNPCPQEWHRDSYLAVLQEPEVEFKVIEIKVKKTEQYEHVIY